MTLIRPFIVMIGALTLLSCAPKGSDLGASSATDVTPSSDSVPAATPSFWSGHTSCRSSIVDTGQKGSAATNARGLYSDTKMIPGTSWPAIAFVDQSALALKLTYWDGIQYSTEIVSGDSTGAFVRLALLSNGTPLVFWTLGTSLKAAIRSAPLGSSGTWSAGIIDTGVAPRAAEVAVNPLDQVMVHFLTDTLAAGKPKVLFCGAPCTSPTGFQAMAPNPYIENATITAGQVATGAGWCKASESAYYPVVSYSISTGTRYAVCLNSLSNCLSSANWTAANIVGTTSLSSKVLLDPTVTGDVPKVALKAAAGVVPYKMGTIACSAAPGAFSAGPTLGTATTGTSWLSFLNDAAGKFHLVANESTTSIRYFNSSTTDPVGAWNAAGVMETVATLAASAGGAALDSATNGIYASYGINAVPYDLRLSRVTNYTVASNSATFSRFTPDLSGGIQLSGAGAQLKNISVASTSGGRPAIAYIDFSVGAVTSAKLKYTLRGDDTSSGTWNWEMIPGTVNPQFPSLAFDQNNKPWIGYFDAGMNRFYLATNSLTDGSGYWSTFEFPATPAGAPVALPAANHVAVAMWNNSGTRLPMLIVTDTNAGSKGVKSSVFNPANQTWSTVASIDGLTAGALGASNLSADSDSSGNVVIAYQDLNATRVKYAATSDGGTTWSTPVTVSLANQGPGTNIKINPVTGKPVITYFELANNRVVYNACSGTIASCATGGWTGSNVDAAAGISGLAANNAQLLSTALNFSTEGTALLLFPHGAANDGNLMLSHNFSGSFDSSILNNGANGNLTGAPALNFAVSGWGVAASKNAAGGSFAAYLGPGNWLYATSCGD